jgi:uncharacterized membrane protein
MADSLSSSRMEAFSDGVIAVIITIMVLELKVPPTHDMGDRQALVENLKIGAIYLLSFIQVGIYWVNHHYLLDDLETISHSILWANLALLFTLSLVPFGIEWIGTRGISPVPVAVYATCFCLPALSWTVLANLICRRTNVPPAAGRVKQAFSATVTFSSIFVALHSPWLALAMLGTVAAIWLVPPRRIVEKARALQTGQTPTSHSS